MLPEAPVREWRRLVALGRQQLSTVSSGIGFIGSLGWVVAASLVAGALESAVASAAEKEGIKTLQQAERIFQTLRWSGYTFAIDQIQDLDMPTPIVWTAVRSVSTWVELKTMTRPETAKFMSDHGFTAADIVSDKLPVQTPVPYAMLDDEFVCVTTEDQGRLRIRWSSVEAYKPIVNDRDVIPEPPAPPAVAPPDTTYFLG